VRVLRGHRLAAHRSIELVQHQSKKENKHGSDVHQKRERHRKGGHVGVACGQRPKNVIFGELPKTSTGKIRKNELRDMVRSKN